MTIKRTISTLLLSCTAMFALAGYSSCDPVIENNGFDLWCGDELCFWDLESGAIERVPTWHKSDFGVSFVGSDVRISQFQDLSSGVVDCLQFDIVADVDVTADVVLQMDIYDDGVIDYEQPIPATSYGPVNYQVKLPERYNGVRFIVHKRGTGNAVIAQLYANDAVGCTGAPLQLQSLSVGTPCDSANDCDTEICTPDNAPFVDFSVCGECLSDADCGGDACGVESPDNPFLELYQGCGAAGRHGLGERCVADAECSTGMCVGNICSTCAETADCPNGLACGLAVTDREGVEFWVKPNMCAPGQDMGAAGEPCLSDSDCASSCVGASDLKVCQIDGRLCTDDKDCPGDLGCLTVGLAGGTCD